MRVSIHVSVSIIFLHCCIVCITSPTSKRTVPARTYLKINAVLDVAKKFISFTGVSLSSAHTPKHTHGRTQIQYRLRLSDKTPCQSLIFCVSSDGGSMAVLIKTSTWPHMFHHFPQVIICESSHGRMFELCLGFTGSSKGGENRRKYLDSQCLRACLTLKGLNLSYNYM